MTRREVLWSGVLIAAVVSGCARGPSRDQLRVRDGILVLRLHQQAFLAEWGSPDRTAVATSEEQFSAQWGGGWGGLFKGRRPLDVWTYDQRGVELVFDRQRLVGWRTDKGVQELRSGPRP